MTYYVAKNGNDCNEGTEHSPFETISKAAKVSKKGDTVIVREGTYRECVSPENGGSNELTRITYKPYEGEHVIISGAEQFDTWEHFEDNVWKLTLPNTYFKDYNPYDTLICGNWLILPTEYSLHTGEVYLNGKAFYEVDTIDKTKHPKMRSEGIKLPFSNRDNVTYEYLKHPEDSVFVWYCEVDNENTMIYANFQDFKPNEECVEINVRRSCFYPKKNGVDYITVSGFELEKAATPWTPPTSDQIGLIGPNWAKGWIISNNNIHDAKCSAISIGKDSLSGHNLCTETKQKPGYQYQMEAVFLGIQAGWSKEKIGSHIIKDNVIHDCGQNAVVGHMGCAFSEITGNHIYNIGIKHEFFGWEIAGIKLHAPIDTLISNNIIHDTTLGIWLDWQAQGTRVTKNILFNNNRDANIEVTHGPLLFDRNILTSAYSLDNHAQGTAFVHNLFCGLTAKVSVLDRATPYHFPHSTQVAGYAFVYGNDDRVYNNIYVGGSKLNASHESIGTEAYEDCPYTYEEFIENIKALGKSDHEKHSKIPQPAYVDGNAYVKGAKATSKEKNNYINYYFDPQIKITEHDGAYYLEIHATEEMLEIETQIQGTNTLSTPRLVDYPYDDFDGSEIILDFDFFDKKYDETPCVGPFSDLKIGFNKIKVWG